MSREILVNDRMRKRIREYNYTQDRKGLCLICRTRSYSECPHSWYEVDKVCRAVRNYDGKDVQVRFI